MEYREIGKTGLKASVVGLGAEHLDHKPYETVQPVIDAALEGGVNIIDVFMPGDEVRAFIGKALAGRRKQVMLQGHIGSVDTKGQYDISRDMATCQKGFEGYLRELSTDYIDFGMLFFIDTEEHYNQVMNGPIIEYAQKLKQAGTIRHIGFSSHHPGIASKVVETGLVDIMLFSINPAFDMTPADTHVLETLSDEAFPEAARLAGIDAQREGLYRLCEARGVGITVMKGLGAGRLLSAQHSPFGKALTVGQCIHYALNRPAVASVLVGAATPEQMREALGYLQLSAAQRDYSEVIAGISHTAGSPSCMYCNHCQPCPAGIDIAAVTKYRDIAAVAGGGQTAIAAHYAELTRHGGDCIECRSCEKRCPFKVQVVENMRSAARIFGE